MSNVIEDTFNNYLSCLLQTHLPQLNNNISTMYPTWECYSMNPPIPLGIPQIIVCFKNNVNLASLMF